MFVSEIADYIWIGGHEKFSNGTKYWVDGTQVQLDQLHLHGNLAAEPYLLLLHCNEWGLQDWFPYKALRVLCEI